MRAKRGERGRTSEPFVQNGAGAKPENDMEIACPACGVLIRFSLSDLIDKRELRCLHGHQLAAMSCSGMDEAIAFIASLRSMSEQLAHVQHES